MEFNDDIEMQLFQNDRFFPNKDQYIFEESAPDLLPGLTLPRFRGNNPLGIINMVRVGIFVYDNLPTAYQLGYYGLAGLIGGAAIVAAPADKRFVSRWLISHNNLPRGPRRARARHRGKMSGVSRRDNRKAIVRSRNNLRSRKINRRRKK